MPDTFGTNAIKYGATVLFAVLVTAAYILIATASKRHGEMTLSFKTLFDVGLDPLFVFGIGLSFASTFVRLALFKHIGITNTAFAAELSVVFMAVASYYFFREEIHMKTVIGGIVILVGVIIIES